MIDELRIFLNTTPARWHTRKILNFPSYIVLLNDIYPGVVLNIQIYSFMHDRSPYCSMCGATVKTVGKTTCSTTCRTKSEKTSGAIELRLAKASVTNLLRFGTSNPAKSSTVQATRLATMQTTYGALVSPKTRAAAKQRAPQLNIKGHLTLALKYGVTNASLISGHGDRCKATLMENYGVDHYYKSEEFKKESLDRRWAKYSAYSPDTITIHDISDDDDKKLIFEDPNKMISFTCVCGRPDAVPTETYKWRIRETSTPCINCSGLTTGSKKEKDVGRFINSLGFTTQENKKILDGKEIDILVNEKNIGIEFNGLYYHNDLRIEKNYHLNKTRLASEKGITLIHIFEDEWDFKQEIVKSRIANILGKTSTRIFARKCEVKELSLDEAKKFINDTHIQGYANSSIKLGLFYNGVLVAAMTFCIPSISKGQQAQAGFWELSRFCTSLNTNVVGGASKLLSYFEKTYHPTRLLSFADKRWSTGALYSGLGFIENRDTAINYWYVCKGHRIHRFALRLNDDDDRTLTESENRAAQGYLRIWDCGNKKYIKDYQLTI